MRSRLMVMAALMVLGIAGAARMQVHYLTLGSPSNPAVLVLHGTGGDANDAIYQLLAARNYDPAPRLGRSPRGCW